jgi:hypothetical protein
MRLAPILMLRRLCQALVLARPRMQFTLRGLLLVFTILGALLGWWAQRVRTQQVVVDAIDSSSGFVEYREPTGGLQQWIASACGQDAVCCVRSVSISDKRLIARLGRLRGLERVSIYCDELTDTDLTPHFRLPQLQMLRVAFDPKTNDDLSAEPLPGLSDATLVRVAALPELRWLEIESSRFTEAGVRALEQTATIIGGEVHIPKVVTKPDGTISSSGSSFVFRPDPSERLLQAQRAELVEQSKWFESHRPAVAGQR